jgi:hypothetical protein
MYNYAESGASATIDIGSTILNATALVNNGGTIQSLGYNLSSDNGGGFLTATGDQLNTDPMLGPLQLNGGQTPTHALFSASPAIDAGTNFSGLATDQRGPGFARTVDINLIPNVADGTDIGAFELQAPQPPVITSTNSVTFITGYSNSFRIVATGIPGPAIYETGILPAGTGLSKNGILSGTPPLGSGGIYPLTVIASNGAPPLATQYFTLTVVEHCNTVQNNQDSGLGSLRYALDNATNFETITFCPSVTGTIKLTSGQLTVGNGVTIVGPGANVLALDGNGSNRVFYVSSSFPVSISGLTITNGYSTSTAGGIDNEDSPLTVSNCVVTGNHGEYGGGIYNLDAVLNVYNSTLSGNSATYRGGALLNASSAGGNAVVHIYNSTISSNSSVVEGGAFFNYGFGGTATLRILNSTLSGNSSGYGDGIFNDAEFGGSATLDVASTILNATALVNNGGTIQSLGYNLSSDNGGGFLTATGDQTNTNPLLGPLQLNGGQTPTHALLSGSPAIDAGTNFSGLATDQRGPGFARTVDINIIPNVADGTDIGAFEVQPSPPAITSTNSVTFITGYFNSFRIVATGFPGPAIYATGTLPAGTGWSTNGVLSGTPPPGSGGIYPLTVIASNGAPPMATQYLTITVVELAARPSFNTNGLGWILKSDVVGGGPNIANNVFTVTDGFSGENRSAWFDYPLYVGAFEASFTYQDIGGGGADGIGFVIQNDPSGTSALGLAGGGLGYAGISFSVAVLLNIYSGAPGGPSGLMLGANGVGAYDGSGALSGNSYQSTAPVDLDGGNPIAVALRYTGGILQVSLTDAVTSVNFQTNIPVDVTAFTGTNVAWVGITGSDGGVLSHQTVSNFSYVPLPVLLSSPGSGSSVNLSWPASIYGYHLQSTSNVLGNAWSDLPATVTQANGFNLATVPATNSQFFRLVLPP